MGQKIKKSGDNAPLFCKKKIFFFNLLLLLQPRAL